MEPHFNISTTNPERYKNLEQTIQKHQNNYEKYLNNIYETIKSKQFYLHRSKTPGLQPKQSYNNMSNISNLSERPQPKARKNQKGSPTPKQQKTLKSLPKLSAKDILSEEVVSVNNYSPKKTKLKAKGSSTPKCTPQNVQNYGPSVYHFKKFPQNKQALPINLSNMKESQDIRSFLMEEQNRCSGVQRERKTEAITLKDKRIQVREKKVKSINKNNNRNGASQQVNKVGKDHMNLLGLNVQKISYSEKKDFKRFLNINRVEDNLNQDEIDEQFRDVQERCCNNQDRLNQNLRQENISGVVLESAHRGNLNLVDLDFCQELISQKMQFSKRNINAINLTGNVSRRANIGSSSNQRIKHSAVSSSVRQTPKNKFQQQNIDKAQLNPIYQGRYKRYLDMILKISYTYKLYGRIDPEISPEMYCGIKSDKKYKAWIGNGNNGNLLKALIKRRFWWQIVEEKSWDVNFLWTQLKNNEYFKAQQVFMNKEKEKSASLLEDTNQTKMDQSSNLSLNGEDNLSFVSNKQSAKSSLHKGRAQSSLPGSFNNTGSLGQRKGSLSPKKVVQGQQLKFLGKILPSSQKAQFKRANMKVNNAKSFLDKLKVLQIEQFNPTSCRCHNHLQNNFYLGNKKALFYNLKEYYQLSGGNVFKTVPLTFHIKKGMKDPQYKRFIAYYKKRQTNMKRLQKDIQRTGEDKRKMRNIWIVKPGELTNRGNGITVIDEIYELNSIIKSEKTHNDGSQKTFIVQLYIDRPLLYKKRKFDIRHFVLVTHIHGVMKAYWFEEGYVRTSGYQFDIQDFEREIHLTNDAIQKCTPNYGRFEPGNKISYQEFQKYLDTTYPKKNYSFFDQIMPRMKEISLDSVKSSFLKLSPQKLQHNFELFGLDFMIDSDFVPWLIQINTNPCLQITCPLQARLLPQLLDESLRLSLDVIYPPPCHYTNTYRHLVPEAGLNQMKYQLIFDERYDGDCLKKMYNTQKGSNLLEEIGQLEDDQIFEDDGKIMKDEEIILQ